MKLKRETAVETQKKTLSDAQNALLPQPTVDLEAKTAFVNAQVDLINAEIALKEAQAKANAN